MRVYRTQVNGGEPSVHAHYFYDSTGHRVEKLVRKQGGQYEATVYVDGIFEHHRVVRAGSTQENNTLHAMDNQTRVATVRSGEPFPDDSSPAVKYHLGDHLGSSAVVVEDSGAWINREEYTPYGETSFGSFARKRYRFSGRERDEETGLNYHGARYYAPWLGRWMTTDPLGAVDGVNLYEYARANPIDLMDPSGTQVVKTTAVSTVPTASTSQAGPWSSSAKEALRAYTIRSALGIPTLPEFHVPSGEDVANYAKGAVTGALEAVSPISTVPPGEHTEMFQRGRTTYRLFFTLITAGLLGGHSNAGQSPVLATGSSGGVAASLSNLSTAGASVSLAKPWNDLTLFAKNQGEGRGAGKTDIPRDEQGHPLFPSSHSERLPKELERASDPRQFRYALRALKAYLKEHPSGWKEFTRAERRAITDPESARTGRIKGFTWHHDSVDDGVLHLVDREAHRLPHVGSTSLTGRPR